MLTPPIGTVKYHCAMPSDFATLDPDPGTHQHRGRLLEGMAKRTRKILEPKPL